MTYMSCRLLLLVLLLVVEPLLSSRILAVLPLAAKSHHAFFQPVLRALARRGHSLTVYSPFPQETPIPNYRNIVLNTPLNNITKLDTAFWKFSQASKYAVETTIWDVAYPTMEAVFNLGPVVDLIESNDTFDIIFTQALVGQESILGFGHKFQAPIIALQPKSACTVDNRVSGNSLALSYIPDVGVPFSNKMSFTERILNVYSKLKTLYHYHFYQIQRQEKILKEAFKDPSMPNLIDMVYNVSLIFTLGHSSALYSQPVTPNIIPLGGIHIETDRKPLPSAIQKWMDEAENGVIYFSLGTYVPDHSLDPTYFQNYINVFKRLNQRILWKTRADNLNGLPKNVMIGKWMPQQEILAHPNCVLFITHGGLLSQHETIYFGVPVVAVPYIVDQHMNVKFYEENGLGVIMHHNNLEERTIYNSITTVLQNTSYKENSKRLSCIFRDLPMSPSQTVVYWTEYVLRHGGAPHLKPASTLLSWYQLALLDVIVVVFFMLLILLSLIRFTFKGLYNLLVIRKIKKIT